MFVKVDLWTVGRTENGLAALLRLPTSQRCVPVYLDPAEAQAILSSLSGTRLIPPPMSRVLDSFAQAVAVPPESIDIIRASSPGHYRSIIHFRGESTRFALDARTPDSLALAVGRGIPVFLDETIGEEDGIHVSTAETEMPFATQLARLREALESRVAEEDYEEAARIRDRIQVLEKRMDAD